MLRVQHGGGRLGIPYYLAKSAMPSTDPVHSILRRNGKKSLIEPRREETGLRDFRPGPTQISLYCHRRKL